MNTNKVKEKILALQIPDDIANELSQQNFSSDPLLEVATVAKLLDDCKRRRSINSNQQQYSAKREALVLKFQENCQQIINDYPVFSDLEKNKALKMMVMKIALQSKYADIFQKGMAMKFMNDGQSQNLFYEIIHLVIKSENAPLISSMSDLSLEKETSSFFNQLYDVIGTINPKYTEHILSRASVLFSCQYNQGMSCAPSSTYMLKQCLDDEDACGQDVQTWFQTHHTPAHNRDIAKLVDYFESQVE